MKYKISLFILFCLVCGAAPASQPYVPDDLKDWQQWVLHGEEFRSCPRFFNRPDSREAFVCAWAEPLQLVVTARGGRFDLRVQTFTDTWVELPGDLNNFPQNVTLDNQPAQLAEKSARPALYLAAGNHRISGRFDWVRRPETLQVPEELALLTLNVDGRVITNPERRGQTLWLGERKQQTEQPASLNIEVYRLLNDDIPMRLTTLLKLRVSGGAREALLARALPAGFIPISLTSQLPARVEPDGRLRLQLRPGSHEVTLVARALEVRNTFNLEPAEGPWAASEIWSYQDNPRLRVTNPSGANPADPAQVEVPAAWRGFPAFILKPGQTLSIEERGRGVSADRENRLSLNRELWLDFNGDGLTIKDQMSGEMQHLWRLDIAEPYTLQSAKSGEDSLLITEGATPALRGVEVRTPALSLEASSRVTARGGIPVTGWTETMQSVSARLNLPPGYKLMAAMGADRTNGAWVEQWQLLDFFLLLVIAVAVRRLYGNLAGGVALAALALSFHEPGAPIWTWLNLVVALALAGAVTKGLLGRLAGAYRNISFIALLVVLLPFVANQARIAVFPQLEPHADAPYGMTLPSMAASEAPVMERMEKHAAQLTDRMLTEEVVVTGARADSYALKERYDPDAQLQTGPGQASWSWRSASLRWSGPVEPQQTLRLVLFKPWQTALWRVIGALLCAAFFYLLLRASFDLKAPLKHLREGAATAATFAVIAFASWPAELLAEPPQQALLDELKARLTAAPECAPVCASMPGARVDATPNELAIELEVHASESVAIPLPGQADGWHPLSFSVGGRPRALLYRDRSGTLWLNVEAGIHTIRMSGPVPDTDTFQVSFPMLPRALLATATGWELSGIRDQRLVSGAIELSRIRDKAAGELSAGEKLSADRFATFVEVTRVVTLGLDWSVRTVVQRIAPEAGAINVAIPLLEGESVISANVPVRDGNVVVAMAPNEKGFAWQSTLKRDTKVSLSAPADVPWVEIWRLQAGQSWHVEYEGTPLILPARFPSDFWVPEFHPRPGENLSIEVSRPQAAEGETLAIDSVDYMQNVGDRNSTFMLKIAYRSTRGQQHVLDLPDGAELEDVSIDGQKQQLRLDEGRLALPITPGSHEATVTFRLAEGAAMWQRLAPLTINAQAGNLSVGLTLPQNRWVLVTTGPTLGPAVLYWAELAVFLVFAWLLGKTTITPLKTHDWLLLGLGFSTFSWAILMAVAAWLFVMGWRARSTQFGNPLWFNLRQVLLAVVSVGVVLGLVSAIPMALLGNPDMHVVGNGSNMHYLRWFDDRSLGETPSVAALSISMWFYKLLILLWSLWLSFALVRWLPWAWNALRSGGTWAESAPDKLGPVAPNTPKSPDSG
ncbi:MAG: hypothetical protein HKN59_09510 [Gammaproteobacteria bacterium]|nr:hypothetical protein [Gammaproteobacteria bacterium]